MKPKHGALCIGIILAIIATILLIALPGSGNLYVAYGFCLVGITLMVAAVWIANIKNVPVSYAILWQAAGFLPVSLTVSIIVLALQGVKVFTLPAIWHAIVQIILLAITSIRLIGIFSGKNYIEKTEGKVAVQRSRLLNLVAEVETLQYKANAFSDDESKSVRTAIKQVAEALRYSDPMSTDAVAEIDTQIEKKIEKLILVYAAGNIETIVAICGDICTDIKTRNAHLKICK